MRRRYFVAIGFLGGPDDYDHGFVILDRFEDMDMACRYIDGYKFEPGEQVWSVQLRELVEVP